MRPLRQPVSLPSLNSFTRVRAVIDDGVGAVLVIFVSTLVFLVQLLDLLHGLLEEFGQHLRYFVAVGRVAGFAVAAVAGEGEGLGAVGVAVHEIVG